MLGIIHGCCSLNVKLDCCRLPPTLSSSCSFRNGLSSLILQSLFRLFPAFSCFISWLKLWFCVVLIQHFPALKISSTVSSPLVVVFVWALAMNLFIQAVTLRTLFSLPYRSSSNTGSMESVSFAASCTVICGLDFSSAFTLTRTSSFSVSSDWSGEVRTLGLFHYSWFCIRLSTLCPLVRRSAGLISPAMCDHISGMVSDWISVTLFATNCFHFWVELQIQCSVIIESVHILIWCGSGFRVVIKLLASLAPITAPMSSRRGSVIFLRGATLDLDAARLIVGFPSGDSPCK